MGVMIPILMYHEVNESGQLPSGKIRMHPSGCMPARQFEEQMRYLKENNFYSLKLTELFSQSEKLTKGYPVIITFDDGHIGNYIHAFPILKQYGLTATVFITTNWVNRENMISWENASEMLHGGLEIQSHAVSHDPLSTLSDDRLKYELSESKKIIEKHLGSTVEFLSFPHGDYDSRVEPTGKKIGYKRFFTTEPGYFTKGDDRYLVGRIDIRKDYSFKRFTDIVKDRSIYLGLLGLRYRIKQYVRGVIGVNNYRRIYRFVNNIKLEEEIEK